MIEGDWSGRVSGLRDQRVEIAMMRMPDGHGRIELSRFLTPPAVADHRNAPVNTELSLYRDRLSGESTLPHPSGLSPDVPLSLLSSGNTGYVCEAPRSDVHVPTGAARRERERHHTSALTG